MPDYRLAPCVTALPVAVRPLSMTYCAPVIAEVPPEHRQACQPPAPR